MFEESNLVTVEIIFMFLLIYNELFRNIFIRNVFFFCVTLHTQKATGLENRLKFEPKHLKLDSHAPASAPTRKIIYVPFAEDWQTSKAKLFFFRTIIFLSQILWPKKELRSFSHLNVFFFSFSASPPLTLQEFLIAIEKKISCDRESVAEWS